MKNETEILLVGMSRSGNHALVNWIWAQAQGRLCFLNCAEGRTNPFTSCRPLDDGRPWRATEAGFDLAAEAAGALSAKDLLIHSYEDNFLGHVFSPQLRRHRDDWVGRSARRIDMLVLRDPFNLFASRRQAGMDTGRTVALRIWKQHAREFLGDRRHLREDKLVVSYNRWCADRAYRADVAAHLGLAFSDAGREAIAACHGGSSFDGQAYDGRAAEMPVFDRWRRRAEDADYWALFDAETLDLSERIFGTLPAAQWLQRQGGSPPATLRAAG